MFGGKKNEEHAETPEWTPPPAQRETHRSEATAESRTQVGPGTTIRGEITVKGDVTVYGIVEGNLTASGSVEIMKGGQIRADVTGRSVKVVGRVEGKIVSGDRVQLIAGAHVKGDIHSQSLKLEEGVFFQGACVMGENPAEAGLPKIVPMPLEAGQAKAQS